MDVANKIRIMQGFRQLNDTQTAALLKTSRQNLCNKLSRNNFQTNDLQHIADVLDFDMEIVFTDRESGKKI